MHQTVTKMPQLSGIAHENKLMMRLHFANLCGDQTMASKRAENRDNPGARLDVDQNPSIWIVYRRFPGANDALTIHVEACGAKLAQLPLPGAPDGGQIIVKAPDLHAVDGRRKSPPTFCPTGNRPVLTSPRPGRAFADDPAMPWNRGIGDCGRRDRLHNWLDQHIGDRQSLIMCQFLLRLPGGQQRKRQPISGFGHLNDLSCKNYGQTGRPRNRVAADLSD
jgi:hypothetical protein